MQRKAQNGVVEPTSFPIQSMSRCRKRRCDGKRIMALSNRATSFEKNRQRSSWLSTVPSRSVANGLIIHWRGLHVHSRLADEGARQAEVSCAAAVGGGDL
eukprot:6187780-Pleurochrysis_carterae.AAC.4